MHARYCEALAAVYNCRQDPCAQGAGLPWRKTDNKVVKSILKRLVMIVKGAQWERKWAHVKITGVEVRSGLGRFL